MQFRHSPALREEHPELAAAVLLVHGIHARADVGAAVQGQLALARERLQAAGSESELPEIQAWRRAFARMGLKPTQYRCASESLLRRLRKEGDLPTLHPLIDLCNAVSVAHAIPVAALDVERIAFPLEVRHARGDELYEAFSGELEHPEPGEVSFVDASNRAHARRWTHRQSGFSAIRESTRSALIVAEAVHADALRDATRLLESLRQQLAAHWGAAAQATVLTRGQPVFQGPTPDA